MNLSITSIMLSFDNQFFNEYVEGAASRNPKPLKQRPRLVLIEPWRLMTSFGAQKKREVTLHP